MHFLSKSAEHVGKLIATCKTQDVLTIEATAEGEDEWLMVLYGEARARAGVHAELHAQLLQQRAAGARHAKAARNLVYAGSLLEYTKILERWRDEGHMQSPRRSSRPGASALRSRRRIGTTRQVPVPSAMLADPGTSHGRSGRLHQHLALIGRVLERGERRGEPVEADPRR